MKSRNWFWGFFFLLAAVFVVASQTGFFGDVGPLSIAATVLLGALAIHSLIRLNYFGIFLPLALLYMIYQKPFPDVLPNIDPWLLILAAVFVSIGFHILFRPRPPRTHFHSHDGIESFHSHTSEDIDDNHPYAKVSFGNSSKYLHGDCIENGQFYTSFGALEVYFDQAKLSPNGAEIFLDCSFGAIKLFVPRHWRVKDNLRASLGGIDNDTQSARPDGDAPVLTLTGNVQLGGVEVHYI